MSVPPPDAYKVLQVDPEAEQEVLEAAYRRLARKYHPDVATAPDAAQRMVALNAAWDQVGDPARRAAYDRSRAAASGGWSTGSSAASSSAAPSAASPRPPGKPAPGAPDPLDAIFGRGGASPAGGQRPPETVSRDWGSGRSTTGGGYDPSTMRAPDGTGAAGPPPGNPSGSVLRFGRYDGWSLGEIARTDLEYLEWLDRMPIGRPYRDEIDAILRRTGRRRSAAVEQQERRGLFRRR